MKQQAREVNSRACYSFCVFDYELIDAVGVLAFGY